MSLPAIKVEGLWKEYTVGAAQQRHGTFYDLLAHSIKAPFTRLRKLGGQTADSEQFWALRDVNFDIQPGEVVGVIGRNGAGKSTLLKTLSRITAPNRGRIEIRGRLASLLEVGTGFHPELSGRENIYLNGAILGMTRREVERLFDEIVIFAEVEKFLDTPVKRYSSGMYVRLAFAVAAHLETDVLLVDEVLAVGDAAFQRKSLGKMGDVAKSGRTVVFVSHNLSAVSNLCSRVLLFENGMMRFNGPTNEALEIYEERYSDAEGILNPADFGGPLSNQIRFNSVIYMQAGKILNTIDPFQEFSIEVRGIALKKFNTLDLNITLFKDGFRLASCHDTESASEMIEGVFISRFRIAPDMLRSGRYTLGLGAVSSNGNWMWGADVATFLISETPSGKPAYRGDGAIVLPYVSERIQ